MNKELAYIHQLTFWYVSYSHILPTEVVIVEDSSINDGQFANNDRNSNDRASSNNANTKGNANENENKNINKKMRNPIIQIPVWQTGTGTAGGNGWHAGEKHKNLMPFKGKDVSAMESRSLQIFFCLGRQHGKRGKDGCGGWSCWAMKRN